MVDVPDSPRLVPHDTLVAGCRMHHIDIGPTAGHNHGDLLLVHGGHGGWQHWQQNLPALARRHRVVAPDLPGFGGSGDLDEPGVDTLADALAGLIQALGLARVTVVGFSFGTLVSSAIAQRWPQWVSRVLLINPPGISANPGIRSAEATRIHAEITETTRAHGARAGITMTLQRLMLSNQALIDDEMVDTALMLTQQLRFYSRDVSRASHLLPTLQQLPQALQVLIGEDDPYQRHEATARIDRLDALRGQPTATLVPHVAHWLQRDQADWFNERLHGFATGVFDYSTHRAPATTEGDPA